MALSQKTSERRRVFLV